MSLNIINETILKTLELSGKASRACVVGISSIKAQKAGREQES